MMRLLMAMMAMALAAHGGQAEDTEAQAKARAALQQKLEELRVPATNQVPAGTETPANVQPAPEVEPEEGGWSFSFYGSTYLQKNDRDYFQPTIMADHGWLHLEARYNYEDYETASFFVGYNFNFGEAFAVTLTPMLGGALGEAKGYAPAYRLSVEWQRLALYSEGEYFYYADDSDYDYFYNWSELNLDVTHGFHVGLVMQKETSEDVRRGFSVGYGWEMAKLGEFDLTAYFFDLDKSDEMYVFAVGYSF